MARFLHFIHSFTFRKYSNLLLALVWLMGLGFGAAIFCYSGEYTASLMPLAATGQLSIVSLLLSASLPFLLCAVLVLLSMPRLLPVIGFFRAFSYAWMVCAVFCAFGTGGWLIRLLLLFTPTWSCVLLYWYMGHHVSGLRSFSYWSLGFCLFMVGILIFLDYFRVSPLLRKLLS